MRFFNLVLIFLRVVKKIHENFQKMENWIRDKTFFFVIYTSDKKS